MKPSRAMIPGEILCSLLGCVLAWFGGIESGWLHSVLAARNESLIWLVLLGVPCLVSLVLGIRELLNWPTWGLVKREATARWRGRAVLWQGLCWFYAIYFGFDHGALMIGWIGIVCFSYCVWSYLQNRRACREIHYATAVGTR